MPRKQRTPLPLPERKALAIAARDALDAVIYQFHQASSGWESTAESSSLGARQAVEVVSLLKSANRERDELAAANLAANKRIVELEHDRDAARAELARLTTPRPIAEAPRKAGSQIIALWMHGDVVESLDVVCWADMDDGEHPERKFWMNTAGDVVEHMTNYLPLPEVKP